MQTLQHGTQTISNRIACSPISPEPPTPRERRRHHQICQIWGRPLNIPCHASVTFFQFFPLSKIPSSLLNFSLPSSLSTHVLSLSFPTSSKTVLAPVTYANTIPCNTSVLLSQEPMSSLRAGIMSILFIGEQCPAHS